jgi:hypothetical protein
MYTVDEILESSEEIMITRAVAVDIAHKHGVNLDTWIDALHADELDLRSLFMWLGY